ncbi:MAG: DEAD/DEAH box helicase [Planctomycetaceae bacterium]
MTTTFADFDFVEPIQITLEKENYTKPTPIQAQSIPHLMQGRDLLGCAQTGTGKTAAFALPILNRLAQTRRPVVARKPRVLILAPTRELAQQIDESFSTYGRGLKFRQAVVVGGVSQLPQTRMLNRGIDILVATPGRLLDLMSQGAVRLDGLDTFVLDEADRMLDMGFLPSIEKIIAALPAQRQSLFFSATMPPALTPLIGKLLRDPVKIEVAPQSTTAERIEQHVLFVAREDKKSLLQSVLSDKNVRRAIVFARTKHGADKLARWLDSVGISTDSIHGDKSQAARQRALYGFRDGRTRVLVATDIAARGIDIDDISHVINFDLPVEPENYVHRIGRTARAGAQGIALTFCDAEERGALRGIERMIQKQIPVRTDHPYHLQMSSAPSSSAPARRPGRPQRRPGAPAGSGNRQFGKPPQAGSSTNRPARRPQKAASGRRMGAAPERQSQK